MPDDELPILASPPVLARLRALLKLKLKGTGGIECNQSLDGSTWTIAFRRPQGGSSSSSPGTVRTVLVKRNGGADGSETTYASYTYDLYDPADTSYETKLNTNGVLGPEHCYTRGWKMNVNAAADGSFGIAYYDADQSLHLWDCKETPATQFKCTS